MEDTKKEVLNNVEKLSTDLYKKAWGQRVEVISTADVKTDNRIFNISDGITSPCEISIVAFPVIG